MNLYLGMIGNSSCSVISEVNKQVELALFHEF
jgi:hypothetical protein